MTRPHLLALPLLLLLLGAAASAGDTPAGLKPYVSVDAPAVILNHVRVIDGTGGPAREDQRVELAGTRIVSVGPANARAAVPAGAKVLDLTGRSVMPGLVGMHEHLFYPTPNRPSDGQYAYVPMIDSGPRLYLAGGVTSARTTGTVEPYTDLSLKKKIDAGETPGPKFHVSGPYLGDYDGLIVQAHTLEGPDDAARTVDYWAAEGASSFKVYMYIKPDELKAVIEHAHARGIKVTGHLCSVGFREAAALGIDNLEHGVVVDTEFYPGKKPGICPAAEAEEDLAKNLDIASAQVSAMIEDLVQHHVAVTSTLAVFEVSVPNRPPLKSLARVREAMSAEAWSWYVSRRARIAEVPAATDAALLAKEMQFERAFVKAGGLLLAGADPTSFGGVLPGYGDQRGLELLVEAGFSPLEAIHIATENGAIFLGEQATLGTIAPGKVADLVVLAGDPSTHIEDVERVEIVFKDGLGYDPKKLADSVRGLVGLR